MEKTFNVGTDNVMKAYKKVWEHIYTANAGKHSLPGAKKCMMKDEFEMFVEFSLLMNDLMPARDASLIFNLSM